MVICWTDDLSVGHGRIDDQHKELFSRYDKLIEACKEGNGREAIVPMLAFLMKYVDEHFLEEEKYMRKYDYPEKEEHIKEHRELTDHVSTVYEELKENGATLFVITSINHTLLSWLLRHVKQTDIKLGRFLSQQVV
jgi:hemerythrin